MQQAGKIPRRVKSRTIQIFTWPTMHMTEQLKLKVTCMLYLLSTEKGGAVPYRDLVTILRLASMQYITKFAMLQSQKHGSLFRRKKLKSKLPVPTLKISIGHKIVLRGFCQNVQPYKFLVNK